MRSMVLMFGCFIMVFGVANGWGGRHHGGHTMTWSSRAHAADRSADLPTRVERLEDQVDDLKGNVKGFGGLAFLFGVVCALWAQNSGRNPWLWFFLGVVFSAITAIVMLAKNSEDRKVRAAPPVYPG